MSGIIKNKIFCLYTLVRKERAMMTKKIAGIGQFKNELLTAAFYKSSKRTVSFNVVLIILSWVDLSHIHPQDQIAWSCESVLNSFG